MSEALRLADAIQKAIRPEASLPIGDWARAAQELRRLHAQVEALEADAARYRWLRTGPAMTVTHDVSGAVLVHNHKTRFDGFAKGLDAAIDAAIAKEQT